MTPRTSHAIRLVAFIVTVALTGACSTAVSRARLDGIGVMGQQGATIRAQRDSARWPWTAADADFMATMLHHHAQAIVMAQWVPTHDADPAIHRLAGRIITAQTDEIQLMRTWLLDRNQPVPDANPAGQTMQMGGMTHTMLMPGMLTDAQMQELDGARGKEFDRLFLTYMIQHHRGAVTMVSALPRASHQRAGRDHLQVFGRRPHRPEYRSRTHDHDDARDGLHAADAPGLTRAAPRVCQPRFPNEEAVNEGTVPSDYPGRRARRRHRVRVRDATGAGAGRQARSARWP